jgi:predicted transcriptional regulator
MPEETMVQTNFRLPVDLKNWFQQQANRTRRTLTAELIVALEEYRDRHEQGAEAKAPT